MTNGIFLRSAGQHVRSAGTHVRWRIFGLIFVLVVINLVDRVALSVAMPRIAEEFSISPALQGLILSAFFWSYAALQIPGGWLVDRYGPRAVVTGSTVLWGLFQSLAVVATGGIALLLTRLGLGLAEAPLFPAGGKLNSCWLSAGERGRGAVLIDAGSPLGAALGGLIISQLILGLGSWRLAFLVAGLLTVALGLLAWWYLRDHPSEHPGVGEAELSRIMSEPAAPVVVGQRTTALGGRSMVGLLVGRMGWTMVFFGLLTWGPSYLAQARGFDLKQMGLATFVIFLTGAAGSLSSGFIADWLVGRGMPRGTVLKAMLTASGLSSVGAFLVLQQISEPYSAVLLLCATVFFLMWGSLYWSFPALLAPRSKVGLVGGVMNCVGSTSGILVPILAGLILQHTGSYGAVIQFFAVCAAVFVAGTFAINFGDGPATQN